MKPILIILLLNIFLSGCNRNNINSPLEEFNSEVILVANVIDIDKELGFPGVITNSPQYLILQDISLQDNSYFIIIDKHSGLTINNFGIKGKGPNELLHPITLDYLYDNRIGIYDAINMKYNVYSLDNLISDHTLQVEKQVDGNIQTPIQGDRFMKVVSINDSLFVGMWSHPEGRYCLFNDEKNVKKLLYPNFPYDKKHEKESRYIKSFAFQYNLKLSPDRTKLCAASLSCGHLELFNISGDSLIKYLDKLYYLPLYEKLPSDKVLGAVFFKESLPGFSYLDVTDEHIYLSIPSSIKKDIVHQVAVNDYILKYDWEGNAITKYKVDRPIGFFTVDDRNQKIYATTIDTSSYEPKLVYFDLKFY